MKRIIAFLLCLFLSGILISAIGQNDTIKGILEYDNAQCARIDGATVYLKDSSYNIIATTTTNTNLDVSFWFSGLSTGTYYVGVSNISKPWQHCNSNDALAIMQHFAGIITLTGLNLIAADVWDQIGVINGSDAFAVQQRFVNIISSFPLVGDWILNIDYQVVITSGNVFQPILTRCYGDVVN